MSKDECACLECQIREYLLSINGAKANETLWVLRGIAGELLSHASDEMADQWCDDVLTLREAHQERIAGIEVAGHA